MLYPRSVRTVSPACAFFIVWFLLIQLRVDAGEYLIDAWGPENGLPDNFVTSLAQTPEGYLWMGTYNGLARFDGVRFVTFNPANTPQLAHARIVKLFLDAQGVLWINTYDGSLTSWRNGVFTTEWTGKGRDNSEAWLVSSNSRRIVFAFRSGLLISRSLAPGASRSWQVLSPPGDPPGVYYCEDQAGVLWCTTLDGKLWRVTNGRYELLTKACGLCGEQTHWLATDLSKQVWVGTEKEIARWDGRRFEDMSPDGNANLNVSFMFFTQNGGALIAADGKLRKYLNQRWVSELPVSADLLEEQKELWPVLHEDRAGGLWQTTRGQGLIHITPEGTAQQITTADGLPSDHVTCWLQDREGNIWVGLGRGGLARLRERHFEVLGMPNGLPACPAVSVCEDHAGAMWMGTYGAGLNCWHDGVLTNYPLPRQVSEGFVFSAYPDSQGQLWISTGMEDLYIFKDGQLKPAPTTVHGIKSILIDSHDRVWMGTKDGLACWAEGNLRKFSKQGAHCESITNPVRALAEDKQGRVWIGGDDGNIYRYDGDNLQAFPLPQLSSQQAIWSLLADADGSLWVGTSDAGLLHFADGHFTRFTANDGLPDDIICQILDDEQGNLWIGCHRGIFRVSKASLQAFASGGASGLTCSVYDLSDGLPSLQCSEMYQPSAWRGDDGRLWFATAKGVVAVQPSAVPMNSRPPPVVIEEFLVDGKTHPLRDGRSAVSGMDALEVPPGEQNFEFHYTALLLSDAEKIRFRYKLEGFDADWINAEGLRSAHYNYLKPGTYRFHVIAANNDGVWNEIGASVVLKILPHFWETWWFTSLLGVTAMAGVAGVARYTSHRGLRRELERLEGQRVIEQDRARIARDIHDHLGSGLTRINLLGELLLGDQAEVRTNRVGQITSLTCELMRTMDEIVWAVNPKNDTLDNLMNYLCDFAGEYLRTAKIRLRLNVPSPLPDWNLPAEMRHNIFLAMKEILNNVVKHAQAGEVLLGLRLEADWAVLEVQDDGMGFQPGAVRMKSADGLQEHGGNGLGNLEKRASTIGGRCVIQSEPGKGTRIELVIPAPAKRRP